MRADRRALQAAEKPAGIFIVSIILLHLEFRGFLDARAGSDEWLAVFLRRSGDARTGTPPASRDARSRQRFTGFHGRFI